MPDTEAGRALERDVRELAEAFHQVGSLRDHADPNDKTGWNLHGIETCADPYCVDALAAGKAIDAIEREAAARALDEVRERVETVRAVTYIVVEQIPFPLWASFAVAVIVATKLALHVIARRIRRHRD